MIDNEWLNGLKGANMALMFALELCMLGAFGYWGFTTGDSLPMKLVLGLGAPALAGVVWGFLLAPKAKRRLQPPLRQIVELVIFGLAIGVLYLAGQPTLAGIFLGVYAVNFAVRLVFK